MTQAATIIQFNQVRITANDDCAASMAPLDLSLGQGGLALLRCDEDEMAIAVADVAQGLAQPADGAARFLGEAWNDLPASRANSLREWIGRVSSSYGWLSNLDLEENVTLGQRHLTKRPAWEIRSEARRWAQAFGLRDGIPPGRPAGMSPFMLHRAACVRAFLGDPRLIVIEHSSGSDWSGLRKPLIDACSFLRGKGAAILWITSSADASDDRELQPTVALSVRIEQLEGFAH